MKKTLLVLGLSIGLITGLSAFASAGSTMDGLTGLAVTSSADVLDQGKFNVGSRLIHSSKEENNVTSSNNLIPTTLTYGIMSNLEVAGVLPYTSRKEENGSTSDESGLGDVELLGKYKVMGAAEGMPAVALVGKVKLATGDDEKDLGTGALDFGVGAAASMNLGVVNGHGNLGYVITGENDDAKKNPGDQILYNLALDFPVSPQLTLFGELNGIKAGEAEDDGETDKDSDSNEVYMGPGAKFALESYGAVIDGIIQFGVTDDARDWRAGIGGSAEF